MVRIPIPDDGGRATGLPSFSAPEVAPGVFPQAETTQRIGQGLQRAGEAVSLIERLYDEAKSNEAEALLSDSVREVLYHPQNGYMQQVGQAALGDARKAAFQKLRETHSKLSAGLTNGRQRRVFEEASKRILDAETLKSYEHESRQTIAFATGTEKALAISRGIDAARSYGTPQFDEHEAGMVAAVDRHTTLLGYDPTSDVGKLARLKATTELHGTVVRQLVAEERVTDAASHLEKYGAQIDPQELPRLQSHVRRATVDAQSFEAAQWARGRSARLVDQIASLDQWVAGKHLDVEVRDRAVARLRQADDDAYQQRSRDSNTALREAQALAGLQRTRSFDELPLAMRENLERAGADSAFKLWLEQGQQFVTTQRGLRLLLQAEDPTWLRAITLHELDAAAGQDLKPDDHLRLVDAWHKAHDLPAPKNVADSMVGLTLDRRMQEQGWLPLDKELSAEQTNRRNWVFERVKRALGPDSGDQDRVDKVIEATLAETLTVGGETRPRTWWTNQESQEGVFLTDEGSTPAAQVSEGLVTQRLAENRERNRARREYNATAPIGGAVSELLPEDTPSIVRQLAREASNLKRSREVAQADALRWLQSNREPTNTWDKLPDDLRARLDRLGVLQAAKLDWDLWDQSHDFLGRRISPEGPISTSPWGR